MPNVIRVSPHRVVWMVGKIRPPAVHATLVAKATYRLHEGSVAEELAQGLFPTGDVFADDDASRALRYASDFAPFKPRTDLLLVGSAYAPRGRTASQLGVCFRVGKFSKGLKVFGDRRWQEGVAASPLPFERKTLSYENAYGGAGYPQNPIGRGFSGEPGLLPNVEDPTRRVEPAGFGPIPCGWPQRAGKAGTYDAKWLKERWPYFPADFDWTYFNAAPADQRLEGYLRGDEELVFENLHPDHPVYSSRLPGLRVRCFYAPQSRHSREVPMNLDTLWVDMDEEKLVLVWRGVTPIASDRLGEEDLILVASEPLKESPKSPDYYTKLLELRLLEARMTVEEGEEAPVPPPTPEPEPGVEEPEAESVAEDDDADFSAALAAAGIAPPVPKATAPPPKAVADEEASEEAPPNSAEVEILPEEPPPPTREWCLERVAAGEHLENLDLTGIDLSKADLRKVRFLKTVLSRADLSGALLEGADFTAAILSRANLAGAKASAAIFREADLVEAQLTDADLSRANLEGADLSRSRLERAKMSEVQARGALLDHANLWGADLRKGVLAQAILADACLHEANLTEADGTECVLERAVGRGLIAERANFTKVRATLSNFRESNLRKLAAPGAVLEKSYLYRADLSGADLSRAQMEGAKLPEARLTGANLKLARLMRTILRGADLSRANLFQASLERADLTGAKVIDANLFEADLAQTIIEGTRFDQSNLKRALMVSP